MTAPDRFPYRRSLAPRWAKVLCGLMVLGVFFITFHVLIRENPSIGLWLDQALHSQRFVILILLYAIVAGCLIGIGYIVFQSRRVVMNASGYLLHPFIGLQHRFIAQKCLGRKLQWGEEVHHINGQRNDNRINNLCVLSSRDHTMFHYWLSNERRRRRRYPPIYEQKHMLSTEFKGILLERVSS